jgi:hypothetical protein
MAFRAVARECGYDFRLLDEVMRINEEQRQRFLRKVRNALWTLRGKRLGVLGLAFRGGTDDIRESPAVLLIQSLVEEGCSVVAYDPAAMDRAREMLSSKVEFVTNSYDAATGADALLILTEWEEFASLDLRQIARRLRYPIVIDGLLPYNPEIMAAHGHELPTAWVGPRLCRKALLPGNAHKATTRNMSKRRALVTGGAGFVGSHPCDQLLGDGFSVVAADNLLTGRLANIEHLRNDSRRICEGGCLGVVQLRRWPTCFISPVRRARDYAEHGIETLKGGLAGDFYYSDCTQIPAGFLLASTSECYGDPTGASSEERTGDM